MCKKNVYINKSLASYSAVKMYFPLNQNTVSSPATRGERNAVGFTDKRAELVLRVLWKPVYLNQPSQNLKDVKSDKV